MFPKLSIIILTWNSKSDLESCLSSIYENIKLREKEIIVVDNGSADGSAEYIENEHPDVVLIKNKKNLGVAPGRNQAIQIAKGKYILILDVDAMVKPGAIDILVEGMEKHPEVGLSGPKLLSPDGKLQYTCREFPTIWSKFAARLLPINISSVLLRNESYKDWDHSTLSYVGYVIGACQLIRKESMDKVGLYDGRIFYGPEDVDYCLRLWQAGWRVMYNPLAEVVHKEQRITSGRLLSQIRNRFFWIHLKGLLIYFFKHRYLIRRPGPFFLEIVGKLELVGSENGRW